MELREKIISYISSGDYKGNNAQTLSEVFMMEESALFVTLMKELNALEAEHIIARDRKERYFLSSQLGYITGKLRMNARGFGFVENDEVSVYINADKLRFALDQDIVYARSWTNYDGSVEGEIVDVIEHAIHKVVGVVKKKQGRTYFLPDADTIHHPVKITNFDEFKLVNDTKVIVEIDHYGIVLKGHITQVIGYKYDPGIDILSILLEKDINPEFSDDVMNEVHQISDTVLESQHEGRTDLRDLLTVTIDGDDARDFDDAISIEKIENGYRLYVHIADVSYYVRPGSYIDQEAYHRGTSVYVVDRVVAMLPHELCNGICSLNPKVDRLALTCQMDVLRSGEVSEYKLYPSIIQSNERMTYANVNKILAGDVRVQKQYYALLQMFIDMKVCATYIRRRREKLGAIDFDTKEAKIIVDKKCKPVDVVLRDRGESERIIEDFMICANEVVAMHMRWMEIPAMYRIHEQPEPKRMREFAKIAKTLGYTFTGGIQNVYPAQLQAMLEEAKGQENYDVLSTFMLRSMQKARYDRQCVGHFGLALKNYLHFTSPIRRYPDLVVHRMLRRYFFEGENDPNRMEKDEAWIEDAAIQASERERNAVDAEREVESMKKAEYMEKHIGECFDGVISGIMKFGIFVELANTIEGLVHISTLDDDYYHYDEESKTLIGEHCAKVYRMGQKVRVKCVDANRFERNIDFQLLKTKRKKNKRR